MNRVGIVNHGTSNRARSVHEVPGWLLPLPEQNPRSIRLWVLDRFGVGKGVQFVGSSGTTTILVVTLRDPRP